MSAKHVVVLGAGVIGLTTAIRIQEKYPKDIKVTIVAERLQSDARSIKYTSHWAGAHHVSHAGDNEKEQKIDQETFWKFWELSEPGSEAEHCFMRLPQTEFSSEPEPAYHPFGWMPDFKELPESELIPNSVSAVSFTTLTIESPLYLSYLESRFLKNGGSIIKASLQHIHEIMETGPYIFTASQTPASALDPIVRTPPAAVVVCVGLGARTLGGVEDKDMYPIRGQTLVLKAPWVKFGRTLRRGTEWTYIIPRRSGDVIIGGIREADDWYPHPRPEITTDILQRAFTLAPELAPPGDKNPSTESVKSLLLYEGCGLRPARKGGVRIELEWFEGVKGREGDKVPVVYNYGHSGSGYQSSWGSASIALDLLAEALRLDQ
jgi:D-amino-acid oxidase